MEKLEEQYELAVRWRSFELRPAGSPPLSPQRRAQIEASRPLLQRRAREQYGLEIHPGPLGIDSRPALIAEEYAEPQGKGNAFHTAVMQAYWQQGRLIDDKDVLKAIAEQVALNTEHFDDVLANPAFDIRWLCMRSSSNGRLCASSVYKMDGAILSLMVTDLFRNYSNMNLV